MQVTRDRVTRGEKILQAMVGRQGLTQSGHDFLLAALDPMHDTQLKDLQGWPDVECSSSIVRCVKQTIQVQVPSSLAAGNWDCSAVLWPFFNATSMGLTTRVNDRIVLPNPGLAHSHGGLTIYASVSGQPIDYSGISLPPLASLVLDDSYSSGAQRIVGVGIEAVNTTSDLYRQGQVTVYRQSNNTFASNDIQINLNGLPIGFYSGTFLSAPPSTLPEVMLIPGSRQWKAADGAYCVASFVGQDNPPKVVDYIQPLILSSVIPDQTFNLPDGTYPSSSNSVNTQNVIAANPFGVGSPTPAYYQAVPQRLVPLHQSGIFFTGLSPQTTIAFTLNVYVETFPTIAEPSILVLATPSATYDPLALQIFSECLASLPVGVPAGMNPFGEWFAEVVSKASNFLTPVLSAINPALGLASNAAGELARSYQRKQLKAPPAPKPVKISSSTPQNGSTLAAMYRPPRSRARKNKNRQLTSSQYMTAQSPLS